MTEARPLRRYVARPRKESQQNERATDTTMDGSNVSHSCRLTDRLPNARVEPPPRREATRESEAGEARLQRSARPRGWAASGLGDDSVQHRARHHRLAPFAQLFGRTDTI